MIAYLVAFCLLLTQSTSENESLHTEGQTSDGMPRMSFDLSELRNKADDKNNKLVAALKARKEAGKLEYTMIFAGKCAPGTEIVNAEQCMAAAKKFKSENEPWVYRKKRSSSSKTGGCYGKTKSHLAYFCTEKISSSSPAVRREASSSYPYFCISPPGCDKDGCGGCKSYNWQGVDVALELGEKCEYDEEVGACTTDSFYCSETLPIEVASSVLSTNTPIVIINVLLALNLVFMGWMAYSRRKLANQIVPLLESDAE